MTKRTVVISGFNGKYVSLMPGRVVELDIGSVKIESVFRLDTDRSTQCV